MIITAIVCAVALPACTADAPADQSGAAAQAALTRTAPIENGDAVAPGLTVTGAGDATGTPDVVRVTVGVEVQRDAVQPALDEANAATNRVLAALDEADIAAQDRQTTEFSVRPAYGGGPEGGEQISGYVVTNLVEVTVRGTDRVGPVLQAITDAGGDATRIQGVRFDLENDGSQRQAARQAAFEDARTTAEQYAQLAGRSLGELIGIEEVTTGSPRTAMAQEAAGADAAVPIEPGEQQVVVRIVTRWALE